MSEPDSSLPVFVYGMLKPGELGWLRIRRFVDPSVRPGRARGSLYERDGLLLLLDGHHPVDGAVIQFRVGTTGEAFASISDLEKKLYEWAVREIELPNGGQVRTNVLMGRSVDGAQRFEGIWSTRDDPLFREGFDVVRDLAAGATPGLGLRNALRLQAAYMLLWTMIERYASLRYDITGPGATEKVRRIATEAAFSDALRRRVTREDKIWRADLPDERRKLDPNDPESSLDYYYAVRGNITHRGKAAGITDHRRVHDSLEELTTIFRAVLDAAFTEAESDAEAA